MNNDTIEEIYQKADEMAAKRELKHQQWLEEACRELDKARVRHGIAPKDIKEDLKNDK